MVVATKKESAPESPVSVVTQIIACITIGQGEAGEENMAGVNLCITAGGINLDTTDSGVSQTIGLAEIPSAFDDPVLAAPFMLRTVNGLSIYKRLVRYPSDSLPER